MSFQRVTLRLARGAEPLRQALVRPVFEASIACWRAEFRPSKTGAGRGPVVCRQEGAAPPANRSPTLGETVLQNHFLAPDIDAS
jgi:hypothetical protein